MRKMLRHRQEFKKKFTTALHDDNEEEQNKFNIKPKFDFQLLYNNDHQIIDGLKVIQKLNGKIKILILNRLRRYLLHIICTHYM